MLRQSRVAGVPSRPYRPHSPTVSIPGPSTQAPEFNTFGAPGTSPSFNHILPTLSALDEVDSPLFPELHNKSGAGKSGLSETFKRITISAGIPLEKRGGDVTGSRFTACAIRSTLRWPMQVSQRKCVTNSLATRTRILTGPTPPSVNPHSSKLPGLAHFHPPIPAPP